MQITSYIGRSEKPYLEVVEGIEAETGFKPLIKTTRDTLHGKLDSFGVAGPPGFAQPVEVFVKPRGKAAILFRFESSGVRGRTLAEILTLGLGDEVDLPKLFADREIGEIWPGSFAVDRAKRFINENVGELSPNGKFLADLPIREQVRKLYDDETRGIIAELISTFGNNPIVPEVMEEYGINVEEALPDRTISSKRYFVYCTDCVSMHLGFGTKRRAEEAASEAGSCGTCGSKNLSVTETHELNDGIRRGISQGLWLESLATDVMAEFTSDLWTGIMAGLNELDVLGVYADRTILIECKDKSLGQNDVYVTAQKAQDINADKVILVSTEKIHPNVTTIVDGLNQGQRERTFHVISEDTESAIRTAITSCISDMRTDFVREWLAGDRRVARMRWAA